MNETYYTDGKEAIYSVQIEYGGNSDVSVSHPFNTLNKAKKAVKDTFKTSKRLHTEIKKASIVKREWSVWHNNESSPESKETLIWKLNK